MPGLYFLKTRRGTGENEEYHAYKMEETLFARVKADTSQISDLTIYPNPDTLALQDHALVAMDLSPGIFPYVKPPLNTAINTVCPSRSTIRDASEATALSAPHG